MAFNEEVNWVIVLVGILVLPAYLAMMVPQAAAGPIADVSYAQPMIGAIVAFIALCILGMIVAAGMLGAIAKIAAYHGPFQRW